MQEPIISDIAFFVCIFLPQQNQLEVAKQDLKTKAVEIDLLKQTIANQDEEVKSLLTEFRAKEALLRMRLSQGIEPNPTQQLKLQRLTKEVSELRAKLINAEDAKKEAERRMKAAELESWLLQKIVRENMRSPPHVAPKPARKSTQKSTPPEVIHLSLIFISPLTIQ